MKHFSPIIHKQRRLEVADGSAKCCGHISHVYYLLQVIFHIILKISHLK